MRDPFTWSLPLFRLRNIMVRVHVLFPIVAAGIILRAAFEKNVFAGTWIDVAMLVGLAFGVVLLHEFGHCRGARMVDGEANDILIWPLGGLAFCDVPHTPRANLITAAAGPVVNVIICILSGLLFLVITNFELQPAWNPFWYPFRVDPVGAIELYRWSGAVQTTTHVGVIILARTFWISWVLFLLNVLIIGFPMDGGRIFQSILWPYYGYHRATVATVFAGFIFAIVLGVISLMTSELLLLCLALFIYFCSRQEWIRVVMGAEDSQLGYDFSQGYTSLERDQPSPPVRRPNFIQRWLQARAARKLQREREEREAEERRMDELLEKIQNQGQQSLTDEERRFLTRVSARYRNRHS